MLETTVFFSYIILFWFDSECFDLVKTISNSFVHKSGSITINFNANIYANKENHRNLKSSC